MAIKQRNAWSTRQAAHWAGMNVRVLSDLFDQGLLPAIPVGGPQDQQMPSGRKRRRRVGRWIVPREAFIAAWKTFTMPRRGKRRTAE